MGTKIIQGHSFCFQRVYSFNCRVKTKIHGREKKLTYKPNSLRQRPYLIQLLKNDHLSNFLLVLIWGNHASSPQDSEWRSNGNKWPSGITIQGQPHVSKAVFEKRSGACLLTSQTKALEPTELEAENWELKRAKILAGPVKNQPWAYCLLHNG